jgi:hypothetical protein
VTVSDDQIRDSNGLNLPPTVAKRNTIFSFRICGGRRAKNFGGDHVQTWSLFYREPGGLCPRNSHQNFCECVQTFTCTIWQVEVDAIPPKSAWKVTVGDKAFVVALPWSRHHFRSQFPLARHSLGLSTHGATHRSNVQQHPSKPCAA